MFRVVDTLVSLPHVRRFLLLNGALVIFLELYLGNQLGLAPAKLHAFGYYQEERAPYLGTQRVVGAVGVLEKRSGSAADPKRELYLICTISKVCQLFNKALDNA